MAQNNQGNFTRSLPLPRGFAGTRPEQWKDFAYKLKAYLNMQEPDFNNYMDLAAASAEPVTDQSHVLEQEGGRVPDEKGHQDVEATEVPTHYTLQRSSTHDHSVDCHGERIRSMASIMQTLLP